MHILFFNSDINLDFKEQEVEQFKAMWEEGISLENMAKRLKRPQVEIGLLIIDLSYQEEIEPRNVGVFGL